ncbi:MAG: hypothetical protein NTX63_03065 [Candidatus Peregrinibacteria bacterium]|nr:hypothetical protein [Candidatus Peregrinibacteria bacterium]
MTASRGPDDTNNLGGGYQALDALDDFMIADAVTVVVKEQQASVALLQRKLGIGADRATKIIDAMEKDGIVGPSIAPFVPRRVLIQTVPKNFGGQWQQPLEELPSVDSMPSVFAPESLFPEGVTNVPAPVYQEKERDGKIYEKGYYVNDKLRYGWKYVKEDDATVEGVFNEDGSYYSARVRITTLDDGRVVQDLPAFNKNPALDELHHGVFFDAIDFNYEGIISMPYLPKLTMKMVESIGENPQLRESKIAFPNLQEAEKGAIGILCERYKAVYIGKVTQLSDADVADIAVAENSGRSKVVCRPELRSRIEEKKREMEKKDGKSNSIASSASANIGTESILPYDANFTGQGAMKSFNGKSVLVGVFNNGFIRGRSTNENGSFVDIDMSEGNWMKGRGKKTYNDGVIYEGKFNANGLVEGKKIFKDGTIFEGSFDADGNLNGMGKVIYGAGTPTEVTIEGNFDQGILNGQGKKTRKGVTPDTSRDGNIEEGNFKFNILDGRGKRTYDLGTAKEYTQDGTFEDSSFVSGTILRNNGEKTIRRGSQDYTGELDESLTGTGKMYDRKSGVLLRGTFKNGTLWSGYKLVTNSETGKTDTITISEGQERVSEPVQPSRSSGELAGLVESAPRASDIAAPIVTPPIKHSFVSHTPTPHSFTPPPMNAPNNLDTSIETGERDPLFQNAIDWVEQQTGQASLTNLRLALNIPAARTEEILMAMQAKNMVKKSGFMPFPQFFEYTPPVVPVVVPAPAPVSTPVAPAPSAPVPRSNPFPRPAPPASASMLDTYGNEWEGVFDSNLSGHGKVVYQDDGEIREGLFENGVHFEGKRTRRDGATLEGTFDKMSGRLLSGEIVEPGIRIIKGDFDPRSGNLMDGTIKYLDDGSVRTIVNGVVDFGPMPNFTTDPADIDDKSHDEPEPYVRIKGIRENAEFGLFPRSKAAEADRGIERIETLCMRLSEEDQRRIGELHIKFKDRTPPAPGGLKGLLAKKPTGVTPWRAIDTNPGEGNTFVEIDPLRLPANDNEITDYLITAAKKYDNQRKAEMAIEDLERRTQVYGLTLNYDHGSPNFLRSLDGIEKIKNAMMMLNEDETGMLSRSDMLILMVGQKKEDYLDSKYRIILSCDTPLDEDLIASYLRGELRRVEQEDAAGGAPSRKPTKKSVPGIFSKTRGKIAGVLTALAVVGGGAVAAHQINKKPVPVDTKPAPKAPEAPEAAEPLKAPEKAAEEAPKAPEKSAAESGEVKKVDLSKIPVGGKVSFASPEDGVKKGVLKKNSRGKYEPVDAFDFDGDDDGTVVRIQQ